LRWRVLAIPSLRKRKCAAAKASSRFLCETYTRISPEVFRSASVMAATILAASKWLMNSRGFIIHYQLPLAPPPPKLPPPPEKPPPENPPPLPLPLPPLQPPPQPPVDQPPQLERRDPR